MTSRYFTVQPLRNTNMGSYYIIKGKKAKKLIFLQKKQINKYNYTLVFARYAVSGMQTWDIGLGHPNNISLDNE